MNYWLTCAYYLFDDMRHRVKFALGDFETDSGTRHDPSKIDLDESIRYIREVFDDYKKYGKIKKFKGEIAEVGPGDNRGVAMLMLADGAKKVDLVDKFYSKRNDRHQEKIYQRLEKRFPRIKDLGPKLKWHIGPGAAAETFFRGRRRYNFIVSRAVMEHVVDPIGSMKDMIRALRKGGKMLHKIDLSDHKMYSLDHHELKFLEIANWIYSKMSMASGRPNRILINEYQSILGLQPVKYELLVTRLVGVGKIDPHLPYQKIDKRLRDKSIKYVRKVKNKLAHNYRSLPDEVLSINGVFLIVEKI